MRIVFMGTPDAAVTTLRRCLEEGHEVVAVWTQPDKASGRGYRLLAPPVKQFALSKGLTVHQPARLKTEEVRSLFASQDADVAVVVAYGKILPADFLRAPQRGCINVHFSLLPLYRGAAPVNWAIVNGESYTGVTTMFMEESLDTGPILLQRRTRIGERETAPELTVKLGLMGGELLIETLEQLDMITPRPQHDRDATLAPMLTREDGAIRWKDDAYAIERAVRGFQPWPNAHTSFRSQRLIVWSALARPSDTGHAQPGEVLLAKKEEIVVSCGQQTALHLLEVQPEAKRRLSVRDFLNGTHVRVGERLGQN